MSRPTKKPHQATPGCECERCRAVFDEWGQQALGFQRWYQRYGSRFLREVERA